MGLAKAEVNLMRLLAALPQQTDQVKLAHYLATLREQLAVLTGQSGQGGISSISSEKAKEYADQIEAFALKINASSMPDMWEMLNESNDVVGCAVDTSQPIDIDSSFQLRRRKLGKNRIPSSDQALEMMYEVGATSVLETNLSTGKNHKPGTVGKDAQCLIEKHRSLQEDLTDEMVELAQRLKESSLMMHHSLLDSEKVLDSTEQAVEHSIASTNRANQRATEINAQSFKTGCISWLVIFLMCCTFLLMVFLIRIT